MRRSLIITVAASTAMVLLAMLIPMAVLIDDFAMEDQLARAALEVQATETVVSGRDKGTVAVYLSTINDEDGSILTTVLYPDGRSIGPYPGEGARVQEARETGRARVDDIDGGAEILVPVSLGGGSALPSETPVIRVTVLDRGFGQTVRATWGVLGLLGLVLLGGSLLVADRLGRQFVQPIRALAASAVRLGENDLSEPVPQEGPAEVQEVGAALKRLVDRVEELLRRERDNVADLSHRLRTPITALRLDVEALDDPRERERLGRDVDALERMIDAVIREARRSQREGLNASSDAVAAVSGRTGFWAPLAEDQGRAFSITVPDRRVAVAASPADLEALVDVLLDNVFSHTPEGTAVAVSLDAVEGGGAVLTVADAGPGFPTDADVTDRGTSAAGSTGLGLAIARRTAETSGGRLELDRSDGGGAIVRVHLGPAR
jgi:signal transduction histidine kinase